MRRSVTALRSGRRRRYSNRRYLVALISPLPFPSLLKRTHFCFHRWVKQSAPTHLTTERRGQSPSSKIRNSISRTEFLLIHLLLTAGEMFHIGKLSPFLSNSVCDRAASSTEIHRRVRWNPRENSSRRARERAKGKARYIYISIYIYSHI